MIRFALFASFFLGYLLVGFSQEPDFHKLDNYFDSLDMYNKFMGSVAVSRDGKIIYSKSVGYADIEGIIKASNKSKYKIGSISKTFTAVLVLKAVEAGKLSLDESLDKYFPQIKKAKKITISNLLYHKSGIHSYTGGEDYLAWQTTPKSRAELLAFIVKKGTSDFKPGNKSQYSNSNYALLSLIVEDIFEKSYSELITEHITIPLDLKDTYFGGKMKSENNECKSYKYLGSWKVSSELDTSVPLGAGGIVSTPIDLVKFSDGLFSGKLLSTESLKTMQSIKDKFGAGLFITPFYSHVGYGHNGKIDEFESVFTHFADDSISYALTSNGSNYAINNITIAVLSTVYDKPYDIPEFSNYEIKSEDLDNYLGYYLSEDNPLKITVSREANTLIVQAKGQPAFPMEAVKQHQFEYEKLNVTLLFDPEKSSMQLKQNGRQFTFYKKDM